MSRITALLLFLVLKCAEAYAAYLLLIHFKMRHDVLLLYFYGGFSLLQLAFLSSQVFSHGGQNRIAGTPFRASGALTVFLNFILTAASLSYLRFLENDLWNLLTFTLVLSPVMAFFILFYTPLQDRIARISGMKILKISVWPHFLSAIPIFLVPCGAAAVKLYFKKAVNTIDTYALTAAAAVAFITIIFYSVRSVLSARAAGRVIDHFDFYSKNVPAPPQSAGETGFLQNRLAELKNRAQKDGANKALLSGYLSHDIRGNISRLGIPTKGETRTASILNVRYSINSKAMEAPARLSIMDRLVSMTGALAEEYEAYPYFMGQRAMLAFGVPYAYEHSRYNALEAAQKIIAEAGIIARDTETEIKASAGIFTGEVETGLLQTHGPEIPELMVSGYAVDISERIAEATEATGSLLLACPDTIEKLKTRFYVDKTFKIRVIGLGMVLVHEVRV